MRIEGMPDKGGDCRTLASFARAYARAIGSGSPEGTIGKADSVDDNRLTVGVI